MEKDLKSKNFIKGMKTRREVLGNEHVERAVKNTNKIDERFQDFITEGAWGTLWSNEKLSRRDRSLITISLLAAIGHHEELEMHFNASKNTGATFDEISEVLMHVAVYAGVPASNSAFKILKKVFKESN
ncbi:MAG: 4-carboxymuconolactone decarboxylase [SAR116 cluster bacterium]|jgi:4-carboxymuconolactone decarboxylase|nr:4-carboxymuconolactone decarboxylase [SAR116 cluster bacterium]|tara:strand:+ start:147 stop:533 length:387 start_codon:yes stop_codon:yes gene_type:complete